MSNIQYAIIGGGIIGLLTAKELSKTGESIVVFDKSTPGSESSWAGGGIVSPLYPWRYPEAVKSLACWGQDYYPQLAKELLSATGMDIQLKQSGLAFNGLSDQSLAIKWASASKQPYYFDRKLAQQQGLSEDLSEWLVFPEVCQVRPPRMVKALLAFLNAQPNVSFIANSEVLSVACGKQPKVVTRDKVYYPHTVVVNNGAWVKRLLPSIEVKPVKGQMILYEAFSHDLTRIVLHDGRYLIPRDEGRIVVGSTLEEYPDQKMPSRNEKAALERFASRVLPELGKHRVERHWSGLRPGSKDGTPVISALDEYGRSFVNCGHYRNGVVLAPASARLMADLILRRNPIVNPGMYSTVSPIAGARTDCIGTASSHNDSVRHIF